MSATPHLVNFLKTPDIRQHASGNRQDPEVDARPRTDDGKLLNAKQIRARARRRIKRHEKRSQAMSQQEFEALYKPLDDWDMEELARGRPRDTNGGFKGAKPRWINASIHEEAMERFSAAVKSEMGAQTVTALDALRNMLDDSSCDDRGRPMVPASVKVQIAQFLLEHAVGKPKQQVSLDISAKLQGILGVVMVNPNEALAPGSQGGISSHPELGAYTPAHTPGLTFSLSGDQDQERGYEDAELIDG